MRYICTCCGYLYDPEKGDELSRVAAGTAFTELPDGWVCPLCYASPDQFDPLD